MSINFTKLSLLFSGIIVSASVMATSLSTVLQQNWTDLTTTLQKTWYTPDNIDLYIPVITWHNRFTYDDQHILRYNERPWGIGGGISHYDHKGNWNGLYLMAFKDSFDRWEPIGGYGWEATWRPLSDQDFHTGVGLTGGFTQRNNWHYIPVPVLLPLASVGYKAANLQMTYIPGIHNNGNVWFAWLRFSF